MKKNHSILILPAACLCALGQFSNTSAADRSLTEFDASEKEKIKWSITNDSVMGGRSRGKVSLSNSGTLRFSGDLSLENNGGFSTVRTGRVDLDLSDSQGLVMRVKGDGRTYQLRAGTDARYRFMEVSFKADFPTTKGKWTEVRVPFNSLEGSFRGRELKDKAFDPGKIRRLGLLLADKQPGAFDLEVDWIRAYGASGGKDGSARVGNLVEQALADGRFKTLAAALTKADLLDVLQGKDELTVFAPTDEAFAKLPEETLKSLLQPENRERLKAILTYHVSPGTNSLGEALKAGTVPTAQGESLTIAFSKGRALVNNATLVDADISCSNGVIHVIDTVLLPPDPQPKKILAAAAAAGNFKTLLTAIEAAGLDSVLDADGPFTVFAPTDEAIAALPKKTLESLLRDENRDQLKAILTYHVVPGRISAGDALNAGTAKTVNGEKISLAIRDGQFQVNGATIRTTDIDCANGVIHIIDAVLLPPTPSGEEKVSQRAEAKDDACEKKIETSSVDRIRLAIDKGVPVYNDGDSATCARIYETCLEELVKDEQINRNVRSGLAKVLDRGKEVESDKDKAWLFRHSLDSTFVYLQRPHN
jgi:transforming growth factor-beta-induced protein